MSDTQTDLVIQISTSEGVPDATSRNAENAEENRLILELRQRLQPGVEIALIFPGYLAATSILWVTELQSDRSFRAGVRLLGVSALPASEQPEPAVSWDDVPRSAGPAHSHPPIVRQHL